MMSNKRGSEEISNEVLQNPQSEYSTPKRSKLDFLAMIAEMSKKQDDEALAASVAALTGTAVERELLLSSSGSRSDSFPVQVKDPASPKTVAAKSSFAAWKTGKGRKDRSKGAICKDSSGDRKEQSLVDFTGLVGATAKDVHGAGEVAVLQQIPGMKNRHVAFPAADAPIEVAAHSASASKGLLPPMTASKYKGSSSKKGTPPNKNGTSIMKDDGALTQKEKKENSGLLKGSGKSKSKKHDLSHPKASTFPEKVMELLEAGLAPTAVYWLSTGEAIAVDPDNFKNSAAVSKHFRGNKLSSFVRSLNRWGFRRVFYHSLPDKTLAFHHELFQKREPALVKNMKMEGAEKEPELPQGAMAVSSAVTADGKPPTHVGSSQKNLESRFSASSTVPVPLAARPANVLAPASPAFANSSPTLQAIQASFLAANRQAPVPTALPKEPFARAPAGLPKQVSSQSDLGRVAFEVAEGQRALQLQQAMYAEQERSYLELQSLQAQELLQSLVDQQNVAQAEELLMQSMLAEERQRSEIAQQRRQAEQALFQQMLAEQETSSLTAALGGGGAGGLNGEAILRERFLLRQLAGGNPAPAPGLDVLSLLRYQLQGGQQQQVREPSYMEQLILLEQQQQQQQQQRQHEAALLAAHGFRFG